MGCLAKRTIGTSDCKSLPSYLKGFIVTDRDYTMSDADINDGAFWATEIANGNVTMFPFDFIYENISSEPTMEESIMGMVEVHPGNFRLKFSMITDISQHKAIYSWNNSGGRVFLIDTTNQIWGTTPDLGVNYKGLLLDRIHVEKLMLNDGTLSSKTIVNLYLIDNTEVDLRGISSDGSSFINSLVPLSGVTIKVDSASATDIIFEVKTVNSNVVSDVSGLTAPDIILIDANGIAQTTSTLVESLVQPGLYTLSGAALVTGFIKLNVPTLVGPYATDFDVLVTVI